MENIPIHDTRPRILNNIYIYIYLWLHKHLKLKYTQWTLLCVYLCIYSTHTHTHTHTHTVSSYTCLGRGVHCPLVRFPLPLLHQHNHFHWLLSYWSPYLEINIDSRTQIFQFPTQTLKTSLQTGKWICVFPCPLVISKVAHRSCIHLQTHTAHLAPPHGTSKGNCPNKHEASSFAIGGEPDSRTPQ